MIRRLLAGLFPKLTSTGQCFKTVSDRMSVDRRLWRWLIVGSLIVTTRLPVQADEQKLKAAWIYASPVGDMGFAFGHDQARKNLTAKYPWLTTVYAEAVPESNVDRYLARYVVEQNVDVVFTCSFGFMDEIGRAHA